ncbi:MAG: glycosyltransferase [Acidimicrobiia bacterium]|nr:glycosyltransferase [Acidimicrobiia bacterium]MDH3469946.1 glycosyltransferase [Acidimicrobiia bacterium]
MADPKFSFGIPVYNGEPTIRRTVESALAQTFGDIEVVVADNLSTDATEEICTEIALRDRRLRYVRNETNLGQNGNFTEVAKLARGEFFRWLGDDDWVEREYVEACLRAFGERPDAVLATTYQEHVEPGGTVHYEEYEGERVTAADPAKRFDQVLRLLGANPLWIDPVYSTVRRKTLMETGLMRSIRFADAAVACELALAGRWVHVPQRLAGRTFEPLPRGWRAYSQYTGGATTGPVGWLAARSQRIILCYVLARIVASHPALGPRQRVRGWTSIARFYTLMRARQVRRRLRRLIA